LASRSATLRTRRAARSPSAFADRFFGAIVGALLQQLAALADGVDVPDRYVISRCSRR
jgi:hypothetical protein